MKVRTFITEQWLRRSPEELFTFFGDARNLEILTPPWLRFQILTPNPERIQQGSEIEYRIRWRWLPIKWLTSISVWEPPHRFIDEQRRGPYRQWIHEHTFEEKDDGTLIRDRVSYAVPGWILEPLIHRWFVRPDLDRIFAYRQQKMKSLFSNEEESLP